MLLHHVIAVTALSVPTESTAPTAAPVEEAARHAGQSAPRQAPAAATDDPVLAALGSARTLDQIIAATGLAAGEVRGRLTMLELQKRIRRSGTGFERV